MNGDNPTRQEFELESYKLFWKLGHTEVMSGVQIRPIRQFWDETVGVNESNMWMKSKLMNWRMLAPGELSGDRHGITGGFEFTGMCVNPFLYLPWLRSRLEEQGVKFINRHVASVTDAVNICGYSNPVVVNATGLGAKELKGIEDSSVCSVRGQTMWVRLDWGDKPAYIREGKEYTYVIPRAFSGGVIFGGISEKDNLNPKPEEPTRHKILRNVSALEPMAVAAARSIPDRPGEVTRGFAGLRVIKDIVGFRPGRKGGINIAKSVVDGYSVHHCYGFEGAGYIYSGGIGRYIAKNVISELLKKPNRTQSRL
jgi:glycine/D-amino acid oxidase-like deaminating enzyme